MKRQIRNMQTKASEHFYGADYDCIRFPAEKQMVRRLLSDIH